MERPKIDMWTVHYKSTGLKLNRAKSIVAQIPRCPPLILVINLPPLTPKPSYCCRDGTAAMKNYEKRDNPVMTFVLFH